MSYSFHLSQGDLNPAGHNGAAIVTGQNKLIQDLRNALLEPRGTDPANPAYGSTLDGGLNPDGSVTATNIGEPITRERMARIEAEVRRVLSTHQTEQLERIKRENAKYGGKTTVTPAELLHDIVSVDTVSIMDTVLVRCNIRTQQGRILSVTQAAGA